MATTIIKSYDKSKENMMGEKMKEQAALGESQAIAHGDDSAGSSLTDTRTEVDRLFAIASKSFESMTENSQEFLRRSRQTGGQ